MDKAVANEEWKSKFPEITVTHIFSHASNRLPLILQNHVAPKRSDKGKQGFKFEEAWLLWDDCTQVAQDAWENCEGGETTLEMVRLKINGCSLDLRAWGASKTHPGTEEIKALQKRIEWLTCAPPTEQHCGEFLQASKELDEWLRKQEVYWAQRSRVNWIKHGDKNTSFFHLKASQRRQRNFIKGILDPAGRWCEEIEEVAGVAVDYFNNMFSKGSCNRIEECLDAVQPKVSIEMQQTLSSKFSVDEIKAALFQMGPTKAPGPDGMNAIFYQKFWHIVGDNIVSIVLELFNTSYMILDLNRTYIVLIPKIKNPIKVFDYKPISLCNVIYKIIANVLANRLKQILPQIISPTQSAFVLGRLITDNVLVAYEALHTMHGRRKGKIGTLAMKLDISKAYDKVE